MKRSCGGITDKIPETAFKGDRHCCITLCLGCNYPEQLRLHCGTTHYKDKCASSWKTWTFSFMRVWIWTALTCSADQGDTWFSQVTKKMRIKQGLSAAAGIAQWSQQGDRMSECNLVAICCSGLFTIILLWMKPPVCAWEIRFEASSETFGVLLHFILEDVIGFNTGFRLMWIIKDFTLLVKKYIKITFDHGTCPS